MSEHCPKCGADFDGGEIPEGIREFYAPPYRWSRKISVVDPMRDRVVAYACPDCKHHWPRAGYEGVTPELP